MEIKLIAMDLDGTALQNDRKTFSPRLHRALEAAYKRGVIIAPVTGRQFELLPEVLKTHPVWESLAVLCNGAQVRRLSDGQVLSRMDIGAQALRDMLAFAERRSLPVEFSVNGKLHLTARDFDRQLPWPDLQFHRDTILASRGVIVESLEPLCREPVEKINLLCIPAEIRDAVTEELKQIAVSAVWSSATSMEITHPEATKGRGVEELCRLLGVPMETVMALGDSGNDETMLRRAGLGVAMGNAPDYVKAWADAVTETNWNDGAAIAIERYVLTQ